MSAPKVIDTPIVSKASYMVPTAELPAILVRSGVGFGSWGRGENAHEAVVNGEYIDRGDSVVVCQCDAGAYVNEAGELCTTVRGSVFHGIVTISGRGKVDIEIKGKAQPLN